VTPESTVHLWDDIKDFYFSGDIACANLECPLDASKPPSGVPSMCLTAPDLNTSPEMFERFTMGGKGVNFFSTANNHSLDMGEEGLSATLDFLDSKGYMHVGTSRTLNEQSDIPVIEKNGIRIGFISYTYCLNGKDPIPGKEYMTNVLRLNKPDTDISIIKQHVQAAKEKNADIVAAILHWSIEFETYPIENIIKMGHRIMDECDVDIILGGHPHVAQPMEKYLFKDPFTGHQKEGFIVYSLGECVSYNAFSRNSRLALTLKLDIEKGMDSGLPSTRVTGLKVQPVYTWIHTLEDGRCDYRLLDFIKTVEQLKNGQNPYGFNEKQINEFMRLNSLLNDRLLPGKKDNILN
jgi:poly-gamma-glutamate synthesis protein (capsule biosynthesis protein)